jgi:hypothetical protein
MAIQELNTGTLFAIGGNTGQAAPRVFTCDTMDEVVTLCRSLNAQPFPTPTGGIQGNFEDCYPVNITVGAFNTDMAPGSTGGSASYLPTYKKYRVVAQYQLLHDAGSSQSETWPLGLTKPAHPIGSVLSLRIRNSGMFVTMASQCGKYVNDAGNKVADLHPSVSTVIKIPIREFHITCDRLKSVQLPDVSAVAGCVNSDTFLNCPAETLLWETGDDDQSFTPDIDNPRRWRMTALLRQRAIPNGNYGVAGWNHEIYNDGNWYRVLLNNGKPRYTLANFGGVFQR